MKLVAGLGITGQSVLRYLSALGEHALAFDTRNEFDVRSLSQKFEQVEFATGQMPTKWLSQFDEIVLSPGIAQSEPWVQALVAQGKRVIGDIELFARAADKPVIAITGSNGKSTVTTLVGECLTAQGYRTGVGGNIGLAALDLLNDEQDYDVYVLELSSFQLETTNSLKSKSAAVLNISEDHMDRYDSLEDYAQTKFQIFNHAEHCVYPIELQPSLAFIENAEVFGLGLPTSKQTYGVSENALMHLEEPLLEISDMKLSASHYQLNALAAIALCQPFHVSSQTFKTVLSKFTGLPYRTEWVLTHEGVDWINDSKGTNVGATLAALDSFGQQALQKQAQVILIAGGVGKDADFSDLAQSVERFGKRTIVFGQDADQIRSVLPEHKTSKVENLAEAIALANQYATSGDIVLFSPACASFDQFKNYMDRGQFFNETLMALLGDQDA